MEKENAEKLKDLKIKGLREEEIKCDLPERVKEFYSKELCIERDFQIVNVRLTKFDKGISLTLEYA